MKYHSYLRPSLFVFPLLIFVLIADHLHAADQSPRSISYSRALSLFSQGNYEQGLKLYYRFILSENPLLSKECKKEDLRPAKDYFAKILSQNPDHQKAKLFLTLIFRLANKMERANQMIDYLRHLYPRAPLLILVKGEFLLWEQKVKEALQFLNQIPATSQTARLHSFAERLKKNSGLPMINTRGPDSPLPLTADRRRALLGKVNQHLDLLERREAENLLLELRTELPGDPEVGRLLLELYLETNRFEATEKLLQIIRKAIPQSDVLSYIEGKLRFKQRRFVEVLKIIEPLRKKAPENQLLKLMTGEACYSLQKYVQALPFFQELAGKDPLNEKLFFRLLYCLEYCGKLNEAISVLEKRIDRFPENPFLNMEIANLFLFFEKWEKAHKHLKVVLQSNNFFEKLAGEELDFCTLKSTESGPEKSGPAVAFRPAEISSLGQLSTNPDVQEFLLQFETIRQRLPVWK